MSEINKSNNNSTDSLQTIVSEIMERDVDNTHENAKANNLEKKILLKTEGNDNGDNTNGCGSFCFYCDLNYCCN